MIVRWPGEIREGTVSEALVQYEDIVPTLVGLAGGEPAGRLDGISFAGVLKNGDQGSRRFAFGIHNNIPEGPAYPIRSVRDRDYKLIWNLQPDTEYYIKYMMNPERKGTYYYSWLRRAERDPKAAAIITRLAKRPEFELYDLKADPDELHNLATDPEKSALVAGYRKELEGWMERQGDKGIAMDRAFERK